MSKTPEVGLLAPDFTLPGVLLAGGTATRSDYTLTAHRGKPLVLAFYPGDDTPVCTKQLCSYTTDLDRFNDLGAEVWGISPQDLDSHERFARKHNLAFPLLADVDRTVVRQFGITLPGVGLRRSVFILDSGGRITWRHISLVGLGFQPTETLLAALKG